MRPINTITGDEEFSEVFSTMSSCGENLVGKLNDGWRIANALLGHERLATANPQFPLILDRIKAIARATRLSIIRLSRIAWRPPASMSDASALFSHAVELTNNEHSLGPDHRSSSFFLRTSRAQRSADRGAGGHALADRPIATDFGDVDVAASFLQSRRVTIYGGSSEIQRNILARRVLNLPIN